MFVLHFYLERSNFPYSRHKFWVFVTEAWVFPRKFVWNPGFFCAKPKNSVPDFQKLSSPKFRKTQFLAKNSVSNHSKTEFFRKFSPKITKKCLKNSKFGKTQFQKSKNSVPKSQKLSFPEIHDSQMAWTAHKKILYGAMKNVSFIVAVHNRHEQCQKFWGNVNYYQQSMSV